MTIIEPSGFATDWSGPSAVRSTPLPHYDSARAQMDEYHRTAVPGDPSGAGQAVLQIVDAEHPPLRVLLGAGMVEFVEDLYARRLATWREWVAVTEQAAGH